MSRFFLDESGRDHKDSPDAVLARVAIKDEASWTLIQQLHSMEIARFGRRHSDGV